MSCCGQCEGIERLFDRRTAEHELRRYRSRGPEGTTRLLLRAVEDAGVAGATLLDVGGGIGVIQHELLRAGVEHATAVDASSAYLAVAQAEAARRGLADRMTYHHADFVQVADQIAPHDIVTLDRVICCYHDMAALVRLSAARSRRLYGLVYPRDTWWVRLRTVVINAYLRLSRHPFRAFVHSTAAVDEIIQRLGFRLRLRRQTLLWQVVVYTR